MLDADNVLHRFDPDDETDREKIKNCGNDRIKDDRAVGNSGVGHHDKGTGPHNRRHDLAPGGSRGLDPCCKSRAETIRLHQRDGNNAGRGRVRYGGTGNGAGEGRRQNCDKGGAAAKPACDDLGELNDKIRGAGDHQKSSEYHEEGDIRRRDRGDDPEHALVVVHGSEKNIAKGEACRTEGARQPFAQKQDVGHGDDDKDRDDPACKPSRQVHRSNDDNNAGYPVQGRQLPDLARLGESTGVNAVFRVGHPARGSSHKDAIANIQSKRPAPIRIFRKHRR